MSQPAPAPLVPPLALAAAGACVAGAGALANCAVLSALLKHSRNGLFSIIIQLAISDLVLLGTSIGPELWSHNSGTWYFGSGACVAYQGFKVFTSTASAYLVTAIALHTLATINLEKSALRRVKRNGDDDEEIRSSRHSLVTSSDSSTPRTMNVDYRLSDARLSVTLPAVFVWILAASLSVPEFALAVTVRLETVTTCTLDSNHKFNVQLMLTVFNLFLPLFIMCTTSILIVIKLRSKKKLPEIDSCESITALKLSLWLTIVYAVLCAPRSVFSAYRVYFALMSEHISPLHQLDMIAVISLATSGAYLIATVIRPLLCLILVPRLRKLFSFGSRDTDV